MRPSLVLDPAVLAMPAIALDEDAIAASLTQLIELSRTLRKHDHCEIRMIEGVEDYLAAANLYPVTDSIRKSLADSNLSHVYTTEDIRRAIQDILQKIDRVEDISRVEFLIPTAVSCQPDILDGRDGPLREALEVTLTHTAFATEFSGKELVQILVAEHPVRTDVSIYADVDDIDPPASRGVTVKGYSSKFRTSESLQSFIDSLDGPTLWCAAECEAEVISAIKLGAIKVRREAGCSDPHRSCETFVFGAAFLDSLHRSQAAGQGRYATATCEACAHLVAKSQTLELRRMYKLSDTGKRIDVTRDDGAVGWRVHITKSGEAMRLMFWRLGDGTIELSTVSPKNVTDIQ